MDVMKKRWISVILSVMVLTVMCFGSTAAVQVYAAEADSTVENEAPAIVITGTGIVKDGQYTEENIGNEKAYTLSDLKAIADKDMAPGKSENNQYLYSALNTRNTKSIFKVEGVRLSALMSSAGITADLAANKISFIAADGYPVTFDPALAAPGTISKPTPTTGLDKERYYFPNIGEDSDAGKVAVPTVIAWAEGGSKGKLEEPEEVKAYNDNYVRLAAGQLSLSDYNNPLWNGDTEYLVMNIGGDMPDCITINEKSYTRAELLAKPSVTRAYTYTKNNKGEVTDFVKGVPLVEFLAAYNDEDIITISCSDGYDVRPFTKKELADNNYVLAYEKGETKESMTGILDGDDGITGLVKLYGDNQKPVKLISEISVKKAPLTAPKAPKTVNAAKAGYNSAKISWSKAEGADGYIVERYDSKIKDYTQIKKIAGENTLTFTDKGLKTGTKYTYRVKAYKERGEEVACSVASAVKSVTPALAKPVLSKVTAGKKCATVKWKKVAGADGYKIYRATSKNGKYKCVKTVKKGTSVSYKNGSLKKGSKYYYKIKAYRVVDKKNIYSSYSSVKYVKAK